MIHKSLNFKYFKPNLRQESSKTICSLCVALKLNRPPHWSINKLITSHNSKGFTCYQIETITVDQFREEKEEDKNKD